VNATAKSSAYVYGLLAGFEVQSFGASGNQSAFNNGSIESEEELAEWQNGWCDAHEIRVSLGRIAAEVLRAKLRNLS